MREKFSWFSRILGSVGRIYIVKQGNFYIHERLFSKNFLNQRSAKIYYAKFFNFSLFSFSLGNWPVYVLFNWAEVLMAFTQLMTGYPLFSLSN